MRGGVERYYFALTKLLEDNHLKIDFIAGPDSYKRLPALIEDSQDQNKKRFDVTLSEFETYSDITPSRKEGTNAWLAVMRGCNNFCTSSSQETSGDQ